ncbi:ABC transporter substrate-binding protein [Chelatococcus asaccharovorans]|uniref:Sulfonate transport system substrate-binding protein n=1 Tax=Chelatococcus asaccharovorans TaxID=28210 RepID=A0A2V3U541_9HYPH|nr:ABC transporter substrate-binding protein [Chelatococcus asaccharovorans]MBS7703775.1 ABC transporter substrate-binding protein [Chelatococcus asaccharovorans]PXW57935.1 sulfonate transport system substrate-binding protein [Chelatococcus asaccharovorans]
MPPTRRLLIRAAFAAATLISAQAAGADPVTIRIGYAAIGVDNRPFAEGTSAATARAGNFVEDEFKGAPDIKVEWYFFKGAGPAVNEAIANNQLDFAYQGDLPSIIGRANGLKTKLLLASGAHKPTYIASPIDSVVASIKDLKGRKVAVQRGTNGHLSLIKVLEANGLAERDLQILNMDSATANAALAAKEIDAAVGDTGLISLAEKKLAKIVYTTKGDDPRFGRYAHVLVTEAFETAHPDLTQRVTNAFVRAAHWSSEEANRQELLELWGKSGTSTSVLAEFFAGETLKYRNTPLIDELFIDQYRQAAAKSKEFGLLRRDVDFNGWFETKYLDAAIKDLKLEGYWTPYDASGKPRAN